ncbi:MFS transporter [Sphingopyxis sp.]|uniref:MFS transporter n=1 Tax=Sphingopyxis sp. TaxID=1908224 RepID=UPI003D6D7ABE
MAVEHAAWRARLGFGVGGFGVALVYATIGVLLLYFYTKVLGMRADHAGTILAIGALSDAVLDPIVGWLAGRTNTRWGRYRPYLLFGGVPLSFALIAVFVDPGLEGTSLFAYCLLTLTIFRAAFQFIYMPYTSMVVVLTRDADERSDIEGWRAWFIAAGQLVVSFGALSAIDWLGQGDDRQGFLLLSIIFATVTAASFLFTGIVTREIRVGHVADVSHPVKIASLLWRNDQFRIVVLASLACQTGYAILMSGALPFVEQAYGHRELSRWPLTAMTASALLASFLWPAVSRRYGKRATWITGASLAVVTLLVIHFFVLGSIWLLVGGFFVIGIAAQSVLIMQFAAAADSLDYGHWKFGERTEAVGFAVMTLASKVSMAIGNGLLGWCYHMVGYPDAPAGKEAMVDGMLLVYLGLPVLAYGISIFFLRGYIITAALHRQVVADLDERHPPEAAG